MRVKSYWGTKHRYLSNGGSLDDEVGRSRKRLVHLVANQWDDGADGFHNLWNRTRSWKAARPKQWRASKGACPPPRRIL